MTLIPSDKELFFPHVLRVEASAGSGKTFLLACRFVQFLLSEKIPRSRIKNLLAVTFTNEATAEMRRRILKLLKQVAFAEKEANEVLSPLLDMPQTRMKEAARIQVDEILARYDEWQVRTIDSFIYRLILAAPQELGLSWQDEIETHEAPLKRAALDRILLHSAQDPALWGLLQGFVRHYLQFQARLSWWPGKELLRVLEALNEKETTYGLRFETGERQKGSFYLEGELSRSAQDFLKKVEDQGLKLKCYANKAISKVAERELPGALSSKTWETDRLQDLCLKGTSVSQDLSAGWKALRGLAGAYVEKRALEMAGPYLRLLDPWRECLSDLKASSRSIFLSDINGLARRLLQEFILPEVVFRLGDRLYHFLLDEFQDTSVLQWENLFPLIENALAQGGSLFCVGDRKQLLYRWRGSEPGVFQNGPKAFRSLGESGLMDLILPYNWRSREVILRFVSQVFSRANLGHWMGGEPDISEALDPGYIIDVFSGASQELPPAHATSGRNGMVGIELLEQEGRSEETREEAKSRLIRLLEEDILRRHFPRDVLILVRDNQEVQDFSYCLMSAGIPVFSHRQLDIREDPIVQQLIDTLAFLDRPVDDLALASVLTGELLGAIWQAEVPDLSPWEWLEKRGTDHLYQRLREELPGLWEKTLKDAFGSVGFMPPYDLVSMLVHRWDLVQGFPEHSAALDCLLELLHAHGPEYGSNLRGFIQWVETGPDEVFEAKTTQDIDAVRIMTIHKAKGLEADVVILPLATLGVKADASIYSVEDKALRLWHTRKELRNVSQRLSDLYRREYGRNWLDELNVLYVSLTRARDELYLFVPKKVRGRQKNRLISLLEPILNGDSVARQGRIEPGLPVERWTGQIEISERSRKRRAHGVWNWPRYLVRRPRDPEVLISSARRRAMGLGDMVHRLLAGLDGPLDVPSIPEEVQALLQGLLLSVPRVPGSDTDREIDLATMARTICHPLARPLFWPDSKSQTWVEREIADRSGTLFRLDRLVKDHNTLWIGEYKTGSRARAGDRQQVSQYMDLLSGLYPDHEIRGIILYLEKEVVTEVN